MTHEECKELVSRIYGNRAESTEISLCLKFAGRALIDRLYLNQSMSIRQIARACFRSSAYIKGIINGCTIGEDAFIELVDFESRSGK